MLTYRPFRRYLKLQAPRYTSRTGICCPAGYLQGNSSFRLQGVIVGQVYADMLAIEKATGHLVDTTGPKVHSILVGQVYADLQVIR